MNVADDPRAPIVRLTAPGLMSMPSFSHAVVVDGLVHASGVIGTAGSGLSLVPGGIVEETRQALRNLVAALAAGGCTPADVLKVTIYVTDFDRFAEVDALYLEVFGAAPPARTAVSVAGLGLGAAIEIDCVARVRA